MKNNKRTEILIKANNRDIDYIFKLLQIVVDDLNIKGFDYWDNVYTKEIISKKIKDIYKIVVNNKIIGVVNLSNTAPQYYTKLYDMNVTYLSMLYIHPKFRNTYTSLIIKAISLISAPTIILDCTTENRKLNNFYIRKGAVKIGKVNIKNYHGIVYRIQNK